MSKHTPWRLVNGYPTLIVDKNEAGVADTGLYKNNNDENKANAELICRAVNFHEQMVAGIESLLKNCAQFNDLDADIYNLKSILGRVKGGK